MSAALTPEVVVESIDRHFAAGCRSLSAAQLQAHIKFGLCGLCRECATSIAAEAAQKVTA